MITFDSMKQLKIEKPSIEEVVVKNGFTFCYSDYCFIKNKYGYTIARYVESPEQNVRYWEDGGSSHPVNDNDEWHLLKEPPIFSFSLNN